MNFYKAYDTLGKAECESLYEQFHATEVPGEQDTIIRSVLALGKLTDAMVVSVLHIGKMRVARFRTSNLERGTCLRDADSCRRGVRLLVVLGTGHPLLPDSSHNITVVFFLI